MLKQLLCRPVLLSSLTQSSHSKSSLWRLFSSVPASAASSAPVTTTAFATASPAAAASSASPHLPPASLSFPNSEPASAAALVTASNTATAAPYKLTPHHVKQAYKRIRNIVNKSPCDSSPRLSALIGNGVQLHLKKEHSSLVGSYKERGALNKLLQLTDEEKSRGVICSSAGNHAQAVSHHATRLGINAIIVMPTTTPHVKVNSTKEFGAQVKLAGSSFAEALACAVDIAEREGRVFVHAFNDNDVIAGQGTVAIEILEQNPTVDTIVVPIGGGGLAAGMSLFLKQVNPRIRIIGVESAAMPGMLESVKAGRIVSVKNRPTMADGIAVATVGALPFELIRQYVDDIVVVNEDEMAEAVLVLLERERTLVEASGAASLAAVMSGKINRDYIVDKNVVSVLSGGNIDMSMISRIIDKGLVKSGRLARIHVTVPDKPGSLARVCQIIAECNGNIKDVQHVRAYLLAAVGMTQPIVEVETRGFDHVQEIIARIKAEGSLNASLCPAVHSVVENEQCQWQLTVEQSPEAASIKIPFNDFTVNHVEIVNVDAHLQQSGKLIHMQT